MADSTGPLLLATGMTMLSDYMQGAGVEWRVALAGGVAIGLFSTAEHANRDLVVGAAWLALLGSMIIPHKNGRASPADTFLKAWNSTGAASKAT